MCCPFIEKVHRLRAITAVCRENQNPVIRFESCPFNFRKSKSLRNPPRQKLTFRRVYPRQRKASIVRGKCPTPLTSTREARVAVHLICQIILRRCRYRLTRHPIRRTV